MDRSRDGERIRRLRPWFLVAAMALTWLAGVHGATHGCATVMFLRDGTMPDDVAALEHARSAATPADGLAEFVSVAQLRAVAELGPKMMPISIAETLLSMCLVLASAMVLSGRKNARAFAIQALVANAVFSVVAYVLTRDVRDHWIGAVVSAGISLGIPRSGPEAMVGDGRFWFWLWRTKLVVFELGVLVIGAMAVLAKRSRAFLDASSEAATDRELDEEP